MLRKHDPLPIWTTRHSQNLFYNNLKLDNLEIDLQDVLTSVEDQHLMFSQLLTIWFIHVNSLLVMVNHKKATSDKG